MPTSKKQLLHEGAEGAFIPSTAFVKQGQKVWFAYGKPTNLDESFGGMQLVESIDDLELIERKAHDGSTIKVPKDGIWVVEGPAQASDLKNANQRYYPREIWEKWIKDQQSPAQQAIRERAMTGHLEHPADGRTDGNKLALVVTGAELREDGTVFARFELLDTPEGQRLQEYTRKRVKWGVSSRGSGSVDESGRVNPKDYVFETWDAVMRPSVTGAHPLPVKESDEGQAPAQGSVKETVAVAEAALDDAKLSIVENVESLCGSALELMDETARQSFRTTLIEAARGLRSVPASPRASRAMSSAFWKLVAVEEASGAASLDDLIESACREASRQGDDGSDIDELVETVQALRQSHDATAQEAEELRAKLEVAESGLRKARLRVQELTGQLAEATTMLAHQGRRVETAEALLAEGAGPRGAGPVNEAIDDVVRQVPQLDAFRVMLEGATSPEQVHEFAETLLPLAMRRAVPDVPDAEPVVEEHRPTLPRGVVRSESDATKITESRHKTPVSRGVALAAGAVASSR